MEPLYLTELRKRLHKKYENIKNHNEKLEKEIRRAKLSNKSLKRTLQNLKNDTVNAAQMPLEKQKQLLSKVFTLSQIKALYQQRCRRKLDDMCVGYTLLRMSNRRFYKYLTEEMRLPLPAFSTITKWINVKNRDSKTRICSGVDEQDDIEDNEESTEVDENNSETELVTIMMVPEEETKEVV